MKNITRILLVGLLVITSTALFAEAKAKKVEYLGLFNMKEKKYIVRSGDKVIEIKRTMTSCGKNKGWFQPFVPAKGITPVTEEDMLHALNDKNAIVVDMRTEDYYLKETIPTAINIPYTEMGVRLNDVGCKEDGNKWDCSNAPKIYGFCNGPVCPQSPMAMREMIRNGFPANKIYYYRGGMLDWDALGLTTVKGEF